MVIPYSAEVFVKGSPEQVRQALAGADISGKLLMLPETLGFIADTSS